ncbi:MAG: stage III sporulation protein AD [Clostridia bacterium]|nr:stage III sporulation protein AD [Clostridia bacterium]
MNIIALAGGAIAAGMLAQLLRRTNPEAAGALAVCAGVLLFGGVLTEAIPVLMEAETWLRDAGAKNPWITILLKCLGTCLVVQFAADCCRDVGEYALAGRVEFAGKAAVAVLSMPMFRAVLKLALELLA